MTKNKLLLFLVVFISITLSSCIYERGDDYVPYISSYEPVIMERNDFEKAIQIKEKQNMKKAGKIYVYNQWIFISDLHKGFHIYDNSTPENPKLTAFLEAPGATDMAIRNETIYINQAVDLVAISINPNTKQVQVLKRIPNTFPILTSPDGFYQPVDTNQQIVVDWIKK